MNTTQTRVDIGFPEDRAQWNGHKAVFDDHTLKIADHPVMEDWEDGYMEVLARIACSKGGRILELGYGMGLSAGRIQNNTIETHVVIECHPDVVQKCVQTHRDAISTGRMHVMSGFWQDITPFLADESFDGILFDTYPLTEAEIHKNHFWFFEEAYRLLKPGGILTYYSDEATDYSESHMQKLLDAGFKRENIDKEITPVSPPADCEYWQHTSFVSPIVRK